MTLTSKLKHTTGLRRATAGALGGLLAVGTCAAALVLHTTIAEARPAAASSTSKAPNPLPVKGALMAGNKMGGDQPMYPEEAKKAKVQGTVALKAVISETGSVEHLEVVSGPEELRRSAVDAVRTWQYRPFLLNGNPVAVETTINVNYTIAP